MPLPLSPTLMETITPRCAGGDSNKTIVARTGFGIRQVQKMRFNYKHFEEVTPPVKTGHQPRKLSPSHEHELLRYLEHRPHAELEEMRVLICH